MADATPDVTISHPDTPRRAIWQGTLENAKAYIEQHFPRHSHDGNGGQIVSAQINHPDGGVSTYHDGVWTHPEEVAVTEPEAPEPTVPAEPDAPAFS